MGFYCDGEHFVNLPAAAANSAIDSRSGIYDIKTNFLSKIHFN